MNLLNNYIMMKISIMIIIETLKIKVYQLKIILIVILYVLTSNKIIHLFIALLKIFIVLKTIFYHLK